MTKHKDNIKPLPAQSRLKELLDYDQVSGVFYWKVNKSSRVLAGDQAGCTGKNGYIRIQIDERRYSAHRLAFAIMGLRCPDYVDHIDGNTANNSWDNLRPSTASQNQGNRKLNLNNASGYRGVAWIAHHKKWLARISINGKRHYLGYFKNKEDAISAYVTAANKHWGAYIGGPVR